MDWYCALAGLAEGAFEEEVKASFFLSIVAENTSVIIMEHILSPHQVSGAQPVPYKPPKEELMLTLVAGILEQGEEGDASV